MVLPLLMFSTETQIQKYYARKDYARVIDIIQMKQINLITGIEDYLICARTAFMFGLYEESSNFYHTVQIMEDDYLNAQDLLNYAFSLMKQGKSDQVLSNPCFSDENRLIPWLSLLKNIAATRDTYIKMKDALVTVSNMSLVFLPQYGLNYFEDRVYYSYSRFPKLTGSNSWSDKKIIDRRGELAGIRSRIVTANGNDAPLEVLKGKLKGSGRIATMHSCDNQQNYFATIVSKNGKPEQIVVKGNRFPEFPFNSISYACAMPYFNQADQRLYFSSDMPGGYGGWDIYFCEFRDGQWKWPVNMGRKVNGPFDELFPSIYKDLLLFSSEAQEGLGDFDNYSYSLTTGMLRNLWPFNTTDADLSIRIIQDNPLRAIGVNGQNANYYTSSHSLESILNQSGTNGVINRFANATKDTIPAGTPATNFRVPKEGIDSKGKDLTDFTPQTTMDLGNFPTKHFTLGEVFLGNIDFNNNQAALNPEHIQQLESVIKTIRKKDYTNLVIRSFSQGGGKEKDKGYLSYQRALGVVNFLKSRFPDSENRFFFVVVEGARLSNTKLEGNDAERGVEIHAVQKGLPFSYVYSFEKRAGETDSNVAGIFNNKLEAFKELNSNTPENEPNSKTIYIGIQGIHLVSPGETIVKISQKYNCQVNQLLKANRKVNQNLVVAEKLIIPLPFTNLKNLN
jgi:outer membrane protein OmpA-like peptidoglycan-associated protein